MKNFKTMKEANKPAFPMIHELGIEHGITKREYFAAAALQGLLAGDVNSASNSSTIVGLSIKLADHLLSSMNPEPTKANEVQESPFRTQECVQIKHDFNNDRKILINQGYCPHCGSLLHSIKRHDYVTCKCGKSSLDGGRDYVRVIGDTITTTIYN